jgi:hypothetical protein
MKSFEQILSEGFYDPGIFKAFFLAGGPGSGKSFVTRNVFYRFRFKDLLIQILIFERQFKENAGLSLSIAG